MHCIVHGVTGLLLGITVLGLIWMASAVAATATDKAGVLEDRHYTEQKGDRTQNVLWRLTRHGKGYQLSYRKGTEHHLTRTDEHMDTQSWSMNDPGRACAIEAVHDKGIIRIEGTVDGHRIEKQFDVDDAPWFQATSFSLRRLVVSDRKEFEFWTIRPDNLKAYKLRAVKSGRETLDILDEHIETIKIQLCLTGWRAPFWKCQYWFNTEDGAYVRFEGQADPLGGTQFTVTYDGSSPSVPSEMPSANARASALPHGDSEQP